jgi:hypothetical protein
MTLKGVIQLEVGFHQLLVGIQDDKVRIAFAGVNAQEK